MLIRSPFTQHDPLAGGSSGFLGTAPYFGYPRPGPSMPRTSQPIPISGSWAIPTPGLATKTALPPEASPNFVFTGSSAGTLSSTQTG